MRLSFYGLTLDVARVTVSLYTPWRSAALEHRLFDAIRKLPGVKHEKAPEEERLDLADAEAWGKAWEAVVRVLKGWQEDADPRREKRNWRWLIEADTDDYGYDHAGEPLTLWAFLRLSIEQGGPGGEYKVDEVELEGFSVRFWPAGRE